MGHHLREYKLSPLDFFHHFACFCVGILSILMENMSLARLLETQSQRSLDCASFLTIYKVIYLHKYKWSLPLRNLQSYEER